MVRSYPDIPLDILLSFIREDAPFGDITSEAIIPNVDCSAAIILNQDAIIAGLEEVIKLFTHYGVTAASHCRDGDEETRGTVIATLKGDAHSILLIERTALNLLGRMSGIASTAHALSTRVKAINPSCNIAATRKTAPGLRLLDKKAVLIGGADPHRFSLSDAVLIKDNHRVLVPLTEGIRRARIQSAYHLIEAEADTVDEAVEAAQAGVDILLLDNMTPEIVASVINTLETEGLRSKVIIEVSGMITPDTIDRYAELPIDRISLGMLTHSVRSVDFSLDVSQEI